MTKGTPRVGRRLVASVVLSAASAGAASASDFVVSSGDFTVGSNWSTGVVPGAGDVANINNGGTAYVRGADPVTLRPADNINVAGLTLGAGTNQSGGLVMSGGTLAVTPAGTVDYAANAVVVGDQGLGTFTLSGGTVNLAGSDLVVARGLRPSLEPGQTWMSMTGGTINLGGTFSVSPGRPSSLRDNAAEVLGGAVNAGGGIRVGYGVFVPGGGQNVRGQLTIGGSASVVAGNSLGAGKAAGVAGAGAGISLGRYVWSTGDLTVQDQAVVKTLRLTAGAGSSTLLLRDNAQVYVVNSLGAGTAAAGGAYNSFIGSLGTGDDGGVVGDELNYFATRGLNQVTLQNNALLDVDANAAGRDPSRPELQGLAIGGGNSTMFIKDTARLVVRQRLVIGGVPAGANFNGFDGMGTSTGPKQSAYVSMSGGSLSADEIIVGTGQSAALTVRDAQVETKAYNATYDPTANGGAGSATTSVNAIRLGMLQGSVGSMSVGGHSSVTTGELSVGQYGSGRLSVGESFARIQAREVVFQKFAGSKATLEYEFDSRADTATRATNDVTINGGDLKLTAFHLPDGAYRWNILVADSDGDGAGAVRGRFDTLSGREEMVQIPGQPNFPTGRVFSVVYGPKAVSVGFAYPGDSDYSGTVNFADLLTLAKNYNKSGVQWTQGDFTGDGVVNFGDLLTLAKNYNAGAAPAAVPGASAAFDADLAAAFAAAVPEPGVVGLLGVVMAGALGGRRRRVG